MALKRRFVCSNCSVVVKEIRMCSACKVMGYCTKECQKAAWKEHKPQCKTLRDVENPTSRDPVVKLAERLSLQDEHEILKWIDGVIMQTLDLQHHPENAKIYTVGLRARVTPLPTLSAARPGEQRSVPKVLQLVDCTLTTDRVPPLERNAQDVERAVLENFGPEGAKNIVVVRARWLSESSPWSTVFFPRMYSPEMVAAFVDIKRSGAWGLSEAAITTEKLIELVNQQPYLHADIREKLTIMVEE
ncbi:hypothetical protein PLICRDRAFT_518164 [Plicaturopsis crispa FD-325 SS-3]|nr:hypothetical protein PLICRDRAFT_518164 [Plicaturopsis crispa FD-325 SS-3]